MTDGEVIELFTAADRARQNAPLTTKPPDYGKKFCRHERIDLARDNRRAYCRDCGEERDLFDVLERFASRFEHYIATLKEAQRSAKAAREELADLMRQERNAKARVRKANAKQGLKSCERPFCRYLVDIEASRKNYEAETE